MLHRKMIYRDTNEPIKSQKKKKINMTQQEDPLITKTFGQQLSESSAIMSSL